MRIRNIAIVCNIKREAQDIMPADMYAEFDDIDVPLAIKAALEKRGFLATILEADETLYNNLLMKNYDFVFNIAEGIRGESRESHVPAMLEMLGIPYTGSGVMTQAITLDKTRTKEVLLFHNIPTPRFQLFATGYERLRPELNFPMIVKPNSEGSSKGINNNSLVYDLKSLRKMVRYVVQTYNQPALVEEFLEGREFTVSVIGNKNPRVMPIVEVSFEGLPDHINKMDSFEVKWIWDSPDNPVDSVICPAKISQNLQRQIENVALKTFDALGIKDLCRMDMRLDSFGIPNIIEVNALPGLMPDPLMNSRFPKACFAAGMRYEDIIMTILNEATIRYGFQPLIGVIKGVSETTNSRRLAKNKRDYQ